MTRVAHVITGLDAGGAEFSLLRLVCAMPEFDHQVISLTSGGALVDEFSQAGFCPVELGLSRGVGVIRGLFSLGTALKRAKADVVQTWMCHADLLGGLAARMYTRCPVAWGVHQIGAGSSSPASTRMVQRICAHLSSRVPNRVVVCSDASKAFCLDAGYAADKCVVIYNGVDTEYFKFVAAERAQLRDELGLGQGEIAVLLPARWHPDKDHRNFFEAATLVMQATPGLVFLLVGENLGPQNEPLMRAVENTGRPDAFRLLGFRHDMRSLYSAADLGVLSSRSEALPNVLLEGMACELPFVATDAGDTRQIIGDHGTVVQTADARALAAALLARAKDLTASVQRSPAARARICEKYSLASAVSGYAEVYRSLLRGTVDHRVRGVR